MKLQKSGYNWIDFLVLYSFIGARFDLVKLYPWLIVSIAVLGADGCIMWDSQVGAISEPVGDASDRLCVWTPGKKPQKETRQFK